MLPIRAHTHTHAWTAHLDDCSQLMACRCNVGFSVEPCTAKWQPRHCETARSNILMQHCLRRIDCEASQVGRKLCECAGDYAQLATA